MINYRVDDLDALLVGLAAAGVWIDPKRMNESCGRFAGIKDCDGSRASRTGTSRIARRECNTPGVTPPGERNLTGCCAGA